MATAPTIPTMTIEEMLILPENGVDRELWRGETRERPKTMRNRNHSLVESNIGHELNLWLRGQPGPRGLVVSGEAGFILARDPDTAVGIDVAYVSAEVAARAPNAAYFQGVPVLAVEVLSPSDSQEDIDEKVALYLELGVAIVWVINPRFRTVTVYRPGVEPEFFNVNQEIRAEPHLPGFRAPVARFFG